MSCGDRIHNWMRELTDFFKEAKKQKYGILHKKAIIDFLPKFKKELEEFEKGLMESGLNET